MLSAILVERDSYLLELARYVVLNPVRAGMVRKPHKWTWSSYRASMGLAPAQPFLAVDGLLAQFAKRRTVAQIHHRGKSGAARWVIAMNLDLTHLFFFVVEIGRDSRDMNGRRML